MAADLKNKKYVMEILADAFLIGASAAGLEPHLHDQCYYHSDLINKSFYSAEHILQRMDWVCENQKELCRCEVVLLEEILQDGIHLSAFDTYEGIAPCEYALLLYEGNHAVPAAVVISMMDEVCKLASIVLCRNKELFRVDLGEDHSDANRKYQTDPFRIYTQAEELLLYGLKLFGVRKGISAAIYIMMSTEELRWEMLAYMVENPTATQEDLLEAAYQIKGREQGGL